MADPPIPPAPPGAAPLRVLAAPARAGVPLSVWPAVPAPGSCPAGDGPVPCPARVTAGAVVMLMTAFSRPGDLVAAPDPATGGLIAGAVVTAGRRGAGLTGTAADSSGPGTTGPGPGPCGPARPQPGGPAAFLDGCCRQAGQAALVIITACPEPGCALPGAGGCPDDGPEVLYAACQRVLRPGGILAVITAAVRAPDGPATVIARARAAGLAYAQHIIALHAPIRDGRLTSPASPPGQPPGAGWPPGAHIPAHSDFLIFTSPGGPRHD